MTWLILIAIAGLVLFNVPATKPHAQRLATLTWNWVKSFKIRLWMVLVTILVAALVWPQGLTVVRNRAITAWIAINGSPVAQAPASIPKQESAPPIDSQKVYDAAKSGAHEGATKAVEAATPKVAEAAKSGAHEGATKAVESKPTPPTAPTPVPVPAPAPASPPVQQPTPAPTLTAQQAEFLANAVIVSSDAAQKAKEEAAKAEAAKKAAEAAADKADDAADRSATNADVAKKAMDSANDKITEISTSLGKISIDRSVSGVLRLSIVSSSISSAYPSGRRVWVEQERTTNVVNNILLVGKIGSAFSSRDFQIGVTGVTGRYRIWIEDPSGGFRAPNGTLVSVSDWASISK